jgi:nucleotide sugar dehydrogenase
VVNIKQELLNGDKVLGIWGLGYIGFSSMAYFAKAGVRCLGTDIFESRVSDVNKGVAEIPNLNYWLAFDTQQLAKSGLMRATTDWTKLIDKDVIVHLITVPTERHGKPHFEILKDVAIKLCEYKNIKMDKPPLVIIESTMTINAVDALVIPIFEKHGLRIGKDILLGVAPRRDWFVSPDKTLETLPRVVGGTTPETTDLMYDVASIVTKSVHKAKDHRHSAIVKSVENAYRQVEITLANQLSLAYPDLDMVQILKLVGTKWNVGTYHPSFGCGGYCIPLAPQYVIEGAAHPEFLTLFHESLKTDFSQADRIVDAIASKNIKNVGVLGIAYAPDIKVHVLSPALQIVKGLKSRGINVKVHDPYYSNEEVHHLLEVETFNFPEGLNEFDAVLLVTGHMSYKFAGHSNITQNLKNCRLFMDNLGTFENIRFPDNVEYHQAGDAGWLKH